jgi:phosphatidylethanolamine/phosphatidyl-N-methylethanolamine N-methyltransferase
MQHQRGKPMSSAAGTVTKDRSVKPAGLPPPNDLPMPFDDAIAFLRGFIAHPKEVGSVVPSSGYLERRLVRTAHVDRARTIVELGPGTGGTTRAFLHAMAPDASLLAIELSAVFHARLVERVSDRRFAIQLGSAENLLDILRARRLPPPDAVLSGIPFSTMPFEVGDRIASAIAQCLAPGGRFVAYQVRGHVARFIAPHLGAPEVAWECLNVPPMRVYRWVKHA